MKPNPKVSPKPVVKHNHRSCVEKNGMHYHANAADYRFMATGNREVVRINKDNEKFDRQSATKVSRT